MRYDTVIRGGLIVDGTGNPWFRGDIAMESGRIADVGVVSERNADQILDAEGLVVSPGFIDIHTHSDTSVLVNPKMESAIRQGVTTVCVGNCGDSPYPRSEAAKAALYEQVSAYASAQEYFRDIETRGTSCNIAPLVGHGSVRAAVMGFEAREPTNHELRRMKDLVSEAMDQGALGMSSGLEYSPGFFAKTEELIACAAVATKQ